MPPSFYTDRFSVDSAVFGVGALNLLVETMGEDRVMLGSDLPPNVGIQVESVRVLGLSKDDEAMVLGGTATEVFKLGL